jgi:hypothetical protein
MICNELINRGHHVIVDYQPTSENGIDFAQRLPVDCRNISFFLKLQETESSFAEWF